MSIPFAQSLLSFVSLPYRKDAQEQKTIIDLEARKYIPVPINEVQVDWFIVPSSGPDARPDSPDTEKVDVLIVAVHNDELTLLHDIALGADLSASFYEIEVFSTIRSIVEDSMKSVMVIDIGATSTKTYVVEHGIVALSHTITMGSQDITRAIATGHNISIARAEAIKKEKGVQGEEETHQNLIFSRVFSEAHRVLSQYELTRHRSVEQVLLTGGGGVTKELMPTAKKYFPIDIRIANPFGRTIAPAFIRPVLESVGPEFAVAVGLALRKLEE